MDNSQNKNLPDLRWVPLDGEWEGGGPDELVYIGGEYDPPVPSGSQAAAKTEIAQEEPPKELPDNLSTSATFCLISISKKAALGCRSSLTKATTDPQPRLCFSTIQRRKIC